MYVVELYMNDEFIGYLNGNTVCNHTKDLMKAYMSNDYMKICDKINYILDKTDMDDFWYDYQIVEYQLVEVKRYRSY